MSSVADTIVLNPVGAFEFKGLASEVLYYKDFQDEYGVKMEVVRLGKYKSAVEPFLDNKMSDANRLQIKSLLMDLWGTLNKEVGSARNLNVDTLDDLINKQKIATPEDAVNQGLIDLLGYESDLEEMVKTRLQLEEKDELNFTSVSAVNQSKSDYNKEIKDRIAVVFAKGPILYGEGTKNIIAQGVFIETLNELAEDDWIKGCTSCRFHRAATSNCSNDDQ